MWPTVLVFSCWWVNKHYGHVIRYMLYYIYIYIFSFPNCCEKFSPETRSPSFGKLAPLQEEVPNLVPNPPHFRVNHVSSGGGCKDRSGDSYRTRRWSLPGISADVHGFFSRSWCLFTHVTQGVWLQDLCLFSVFSSGGCDWISRLDFGMHFC